MKRKYLAGSALAIAVLIGSTSANAKVTCFSGPTREDDYYQKWYAENNCPEAVTLHYTEEGPFVTQPNGSSMLPPCSGRTMIIFSSKTDKVTFDPVVHFGRREYDSCSRGNPSASSTSPRRSTVSSQDTSAASLNQQQLNEYLAAPTPTPATPAPASGLAPSIGVAPGYNKTFNSFAADQAACQRYATAQTAPMVSARNNLVTPIVIQQRFDVLYGQCMEAHGNQVPRLAEWELQDRTWQNEIHRAEVQRQIDADNARSQSQNDSDDGGDALGSILQGFLGGMGAASRSAPSYHPTYTASAPRPAPSYSNCGSGRGAACH